MTANLAFNRAMQRKRGLMNRIRGGAAVALGVALLLAAGGVARAQETTGRVTGRVSDRDTNAPMGGVTVVIQGPQGEDATLVTTLDERFDALDALLARHGSIEAGFTFYDQLSEAEIQELAAAVGPTTDGERGIPTGPTS